MNFFNDSAVQVALAWSAWLTGSSGDEELGDCFEDLLSWTVVCLTVKGYHMYNRLSSKADSYFPIINN